MRRLTCYFTACLLISWLTDSAWWETLALIISLHGFVTFIVRLGQYFSILDCIAAIAALEILFVPAAAYWVVPASMPIASSVYFSYALPAWVAFYGGMTSSSSSASIRTATYAEHIREYVQQRPGVSFVLLLIGISGFVVKIRFSMAPALVSTLPMYCLLVSVLYAYCARYKYRSFIGTLVVLILVVNTVRTGMFGELFFWILLWLIVGMANLNRPVPVRMKIFGLVVAFIFLLLIQSIKAEYRYNTWGYQRDERTTDSSLMISLLADRLTHPSKVINVTHCFVAFVRFNQGMMIGSAMARVPMHEPYAHGEVLFSFLYPLIPRILWSGKPQTGGYENIRRFTTMPQFENTSINLSPLGEGYVNFGYGGILFAFVYGVLLGGCFHVVCQMAHRLPSLILWLPMLFIGCLTMETDVLSTWGSLLNNALFVGLLYRSLAWIGVRL